MPTMHITVTDATPTTVTVHTHIVGGEAKTLRHTWAELREAADANHGHPLRNSYLRILADAERILARHRRDAFFAGLPKPLCHVAGIVTQGGGSVRGTLATYLATPEGGWGETDQAWRALVDSIGAATAGADTDAESMAVDLATRAVKAPGFAVHPSRRTARRTAHA